MLENDSAANGTGGNDAVETLPTDAPAAPPIPVSPSPATSAPATQPAAQPPALTPSPAAPSRSFMGALAHALIGSTLATATHTVKALAGPAPVDYTDANGKTVGTPRIDTTVSRLQRLAESALLGLSAGSQVGPQKSKAAGFAAGIGAGASAVRQQGQEQDLLKRKQAQDDFEEQQRATLHKATVAMTNAQTHNLWQKIEDDENAKDTERQKNAGIVSSLNDYVAQNPTSKLTVQTLTEAQAHAMHEADGHTVAKHTFLPMGKTQAKDADGNPVFEADGPTPKFVKQFAAISGSADEKLPMPQAMAEDVQKYSKYDPRLKGAAQIPAGGDMPLTAFLSAYKIVSENKGKEADGWRESKPGENAVMVNGKTVKRNAFTGETQEYGGVPLTVGKEQADIAEKQAGAFEKTAQGKKALAEANGTSEETAGQAIDLVEGDLVPSQLSKRSKSFNTILKAARDYSMSKYGKPFDFEKAERDYRFATNVGTQNTLKYLNSLTGNPKTSEKGNLQLLVDISNNVDRSDFPAQNDADAWEKLQTGDPKYIPLFNVATDVSDQFAKIMAGGGSGAVTSDKKIEQGLKMFRTGFSKTEMKASAQSTLQMLSNRKREFIGDNRYLQKDYGARPQTGQPNLPAGATHIGKDAKGNVVGYVLNGQWVSAGGKQ